jgi:hypothetical protein
MTDLQLRMSGAIDDFDDARSVEEVEELATECAKEVKTSQVNEVGTLSNMPARLYTFGPQ